MKSAAKTNVLCRTHDETERIANDERIPF